MTAQGSPRSIFRRAIERANLAVAETVVRDMGVIGLDEALELTALMAFKDSPRARRAAARWLERYLGERAASIDDGVFVAGCLAALGGPAHREALAALRALAKP
jgi:hypothetical protein